MLFQFRNEALCLFEELPCVVKLFLFRKPRILSDLPHVKIPPAFG